MAKREGMDGGNRAASAGSKMVSEIQRDEVTCPCPIASDWSDGIKMVRPGLCDSRSFFYHIMLPLHLGWPSFHSQSLLQQGSESPQLIPNTQVGLRIIDQ